MTDKFVQRIVNVIVRSQRIPAERVTIDSEFAELNLDSADVVEIIFELEDEFDIVIPDDQMHGVRNVRQAAEAVQRLIAAKALGVAGP